MKHPHKATCTCSACEDAFAALVAAEGARTAQQTPTERAAEEATFRLNCQASLKARGVAPLTGWAW